MKTDELNLHLAKLLDPDTGAEAAESAAKAIRDAFVALTPPTPDDVARDVDDLRLFIAATGVTTCKTGCECKPHSALDRLASAAAQGARVPGLEARLTEVADERDDALAQRDSALELSRTAEAERDAARQEVASERERTQAITTRLEVALGERDHALDDTERLRKRVATLEEREESVSDYLRMMGVSSLETLADDFAQLRQERDVALRARDEKLTLQAAQRDSALREVEALRAQVATLTARVAELERECGDHVAAWEQQRARAEAAERRVQELEALTWDLVRVGVLMFEGAEERADANARHLARLANPPTPAPAGLLETVPLKQDVDTVREALDALAEAAPKPWHTEAARAADIALDRIAKVLGLDTPPAGPGGSCERPPRARHPEPTPEGPALAPEFEGSLSAPSTLEANLKPGSNSTPEVVLNFTTGGPGKEHLRVLAAGALEYETRPGLWVPSVNETGKVLARALAEAKRELKAERENLRKVDRDRCDTINELTREGVRERLAAKDAARKAAESMRERAVDAAWNASSDCTNYQRAEIRDAIRALPLEAE